jgi:hypothetical protein
MLRNKRLRASIQVSMKVNRAKKSNQKWPRTKTYTRNCGKTAQFRIELGTFFWQHHLKADNLFRNANVCWKDFGNLEKLMVD